MTENQKVLRYLDGENTKLYERVNLIVKWEGSFDLDIQVQIGGEWHGTGTSKANINNNDF